MGDAPPSFNESGRPWGENHAKLNFFPFPLLPLLQVFLDYLSLHYLDTNILHISYLLCFTDKYI